MACVFDRMLFCGDRDASQRLSRETRTGETSRNCFEMANGRSLIFAWAGRESGMRQFTVEDGFRDQVPSLIEVFNENHFVA